MNLTPIMQNETLTAESNSSARRKASTSDILGGNRKPKINPAWREQYGQLRDLREQMLDSRRTLASDAKEERANYSIHMADAATDTYDTDWALSMLSSDQNALYEIDEAIRRIETGTYGKCELTGSAIEAERLSAIPWTRFARDAQQQLENQGMAFKTRLAERRGLSDVESAEEEETGEEAAPTAGGTTSNE